MPRECGRRLSVKKGPMWAGELAGDSGLWKTQWWSMMGGLLGHDIPICRGSIWIYHILSHFITMDDENPQQLLRIFDAVDPDPSSNSCNAMWRAKFSILTRTELEWLKMRLGLTLQTICWTICIYLSLNISLPLLYMNETTGCSERSWILHLIWSNQQLPDARPQLGACHALPCGAMADKDDWDFVWWFRVPMCIPC